ncbi:MAG: hypothetical protein WC326_11170 [Candidatus Delongbacteria bacterium]
MRRHHPLPAFAALAALALVAPARAVEIVGTLPGVDVRVVGWQAGAPCLLGEGDLRWLGQDPLGGLLMEQRQEVEAESVELAAGSRLNAVLTGPGMLRVRERGGETPVALQAGFQALAQEGDLLVAATHSMLWHGRLDLADPGLMPWSGGLPHTPTALCVTGGAWWTDADSLRGVDLGNPPQPLGRAALPGVSRLAGGGGRLAACLGDDGLRAVNVDEPSSPTVGPAWSAGLPVYDAAVWRDGLFVLACGDSGLALADLSDVNQPLLLSRWRTVESARRLTLRNDSLLVAEGAAGVSLHVLRQEAGAPRLDLLARHATRPRLLSIPHVDPHEPSFWCLDGGQGFRRIHWDWSWGWDPGPIETADVALPLPVDGGDIAWRHWNEQPLLFAGCRYGAGLRFYEETDGGVQLRGIHPTDPVKLLAWGPDDLIAYVTPDAFVALKQANRNPWFLLHHGTIPLAAEPLCAEWAGRHLLVGCADGRLFDVDATNLGQPVLAGVLQLGGPVLDLSACSWGDGVAAAAGALYWLQPDAAGAYEVTDSVWRAGVVSTCSTTGYGVAATRDPHEVFEFMDHSGSLSCWGEVPLPAAPLAVARCLSTGSCGHALLGLENGDLLRLEVVWEIGVDPGPQRPGRLELVAAPNPFNPATQLAFTLERAAPTARLTVHDVAGRERWRRELGPLAAGTHRQQLGAEGWPSGLYFARLELGDRSASRKLLLVR